MFFNYSLYVSAPQAKFFLTYVYFFYIRANFEELYNIERDPFLKSALGGVGVSRGLLNIIQKYHEAVTIWDVRNGITPLYEISTGMISTQLKNKIRHTLNAEESQIEFFKDSNKYKAYMPSPVRFEEEC